MLAVSLRRQIQLVPGVYINGTTQYLKGWLPAKKLYYMGELRDFVRKQNRPFVLMFFHASKDLRGLKSVDKIKKYRRDIPRGLSLTLAVDCHLTLRVR